MEVFSAFYPLVEPYSWSK